MEVKSISCSFFGLMVQDGLAVHVGFVVYVGLVVLMLMIQG